MNPLSSLDNEYTNKHSKSVESTNRHRIWWFEHLEDITFKYQSVIIDNYNVWRLG